MKTYAWLFDLIYFEGPYQFVNFDLENGCGFVIHDWVGIENEKNVWVSYPVDEPTLYRLLTRQVTFREVYDSVDIAKKEVYLQDGNGYYPSKIEDFERHINTNVTRELYNSILTDDESLLKVEAWIKEKKEIYGSAR